MSADTLPVTQPGTLAVALRTDTAEVGTDQNHSYPADVDTLNVDPFVIPAGLAVASPSGGDSFSATFKVPELLHPTQLRIDPGIADNSMTTPVTLDLTNVPQRSTGLVNPKISGAPMAPIQTGPLALTIAVVPGGIRNYNYDDRFLRAVDVTIKNTDITEDQPVNVSFAVLDGSGRYFAAIGAPGCSSLPPTLGPGQSSTSRLCFDKPEYDRHGNGILPSGLLVTTPEGVKLFTLYGGPGAPD